MITVFVAKWTMRTSSALRAELPVDGAQVAAPTSGCAISAMMPIAVGTSVSSTFDTLLQNDCRQPVASLSPSKGNGDGDGGGMMRARWRKFAESVVLLPLFLAPRV